MAVCISNITQTKTDFQWKMTRDISVHRFRCDIYVAILLNYKTLNFSSNPRIFHCFHTSHRPTKQKFVYRVIKLMTKMKAQITKCVINIYNVTKSYQISFAPSCLSFGFVLSQPQDEMSSLPTLLDSVDKISSSFLWLFAYLEIILYGLLLWLFYRMNRMDEIQFISTFAI